MASHTTRREFLATTAAAALAARSGAPVRAAGKAMRGAFMILHTPFTTDGAVDWDDLARAALFVDRAGCAAVVWPQGSSSVAMLTNAERLRGMELLAATMKGRRAALVLGVQGRDTNEMLAYAKRAEQLAGDAMIAMPPSSGQSEDDYYSYFRALAGVTARPVIVQTSGGNRNVTPSTDLIIRLAREFPHLAYVKEESAPLVARMRAEIAQRPPMKGVFGASLADGWLFEMRLGLDGVITGQSMLADVMARMWELHERGRRDEVRDAYARFLLIRNLEEQLPGTVFYIFKKRGIFKTTVRRIGAPADGAAPKIETVSVPADVAAEIDHRLAALQPYLQPTVGTV
jgi:4-hydroxy-tetrahydrodipicolinate synthase